MTMSGEDLKKHMRALSQDDRKDVLFTCLTKHIDDIGEIDFSAEQKAVIAEALDLRTSAPVSASAELVSEILDKRKAKVVNVNDGTEVKDFGENNLTLLAYVGSQDEANHKFFVVNQQIMAGNEGKGKFMAKMKEAKDKFEKEWVKANKDALLFKFVLEIPLPKVGDTDCEVNTEYVDKQKPFPRAKTAAEMSFKDKFADLEPDERRSLLLELASEDPELSQKLSSSQPRSHRSALRFTPQPSPEPQPKKRGRSASVTRQVLPPEEESIVLSRGVQQEKKTLQASSYTLGKDYIVGKDGSKEIIMAVSIIGKRKRFWSDREMTKPINLGQGRPKIFQDTAADDNEEMERESTRSRTEEIQKRRYVRSDAGTVSDAGVSGDAANDGDADDDQETEMVDE